MSTVARLQALDLAKENYGFLQQAGPTADLRVDSSGKIYVHQAASSIFGGIFGSGENPDVKGLERAKINAEVWGHLIPEIKHLQGKERLSKEDLGLIQSMLEEIQALERKNPFFVSEMKELLKTMDKRLQELSCRYVNQKPSQEGEIKPEPVSGPTLPQDAGGVQPPPQGNATEALTRLAQASAAEQKTEAPSESEEGSSQIKEAAVAIGNAAYIGVGLGASLAVGALFAVKTVALVPYRITKTVAGTVLSANFVRNCLGIANFSRAIEELQKSKVWVPARQGGNEGVAYTGPESVFEVIPRFEQVVGKPRAEERLWGGREYPLQVRVEIPEQRIEKSLEHIDWEHNPLFSRLYIAGSETIIGLMKLGFSLTTATMIALYFLGRYGNENNLCKEECNLDEPAFASSLWESLKQWGSTRANWEQCDTLLEENQTYPKGLQDTFQQGWERNHCDQVAEEALPNCNQLQSETKMSSEQLETKFQQDWTNSDCNTPLEEVNVCNPCDDLQRVYQLDQERLLIDTMNQRWQSYQCEKIDICNSLEERYQNRSTAWQGKFQERWQANYCDDERPKPILDSLFNDMKKNPWKYPMNFKTFVDPAVATTGEKLSMLKGPALATLRGIRNIGQWAHQNPETAFKVGEYVTLAGIAGNAEIKARSSTWLKWPLWRATEIAAIAAIIFLDPLNADAAGFCKELYNRISLD